MSDSLLTVAEIAEMLRVNSQTVRNWIERGELLAIRVGSRRVRVRRSDLDSFMGRERAESEQPQPAERAPAAEVPGLLRELADVVTRLADALEQPSGPAPGGGSHRRTARTRR